MKAIVEAMPKVGGYFVHAAKVRRLGIPILTRHTILRAEGGKERVEKAVVAQLDENWGGQFRGGRRRYSRWTR